MLDSLIRLLHKLSPMLFKLFFLLDCIFLIDDMLYFLSILYKVEAECLKTLEQW